MKDGQKTATERLFGALNSAYKYFNYELFDYKLPSNCVLNLSRKQNTHGFFAPERYRERGTKVYNTHEISLTPTTLYRSPIEIFSTLVHEMCHLWQWEFGSPSRGGYHNKEWARKMIEVGLMPSDTGKEGGKKTGQSMTHFIVSEGAYEIAFGNMPEEYIVPFKSLEGDILQRLIEGEPEPSTTSLPKGKSGKTKPVKSPNRTKYSCPCGENAWGKPTLQMKCRKCGKDFLKV